MNEELIISMSDSIFSYIENFNDINLDAFVKNMSTIIIDKLDLEKYVGDILVLEVYERNPSSRGMLDNENNIYVFRKGIEQSLDEILHDVPGLSEREITLCRCLLYIKTVLHELEHLKQKKLLVEDVQNNSFETLITRLSDPQSDDNNINYYCMYKVYPTERMAEIQATRIIIKVVEQLVNKMSITLLSYYIKKQGIFEEFNNYYKYGLVGPTECFFDFYDSESLTIVKKEELKKDLSLEDRVLYGLEISPKEYEEMVLQYIDYEEKINNHSKAKKK